MKWFIKLNLIVLFFTFINVSASTNVYERNENELRIDESIEVTDDNIWNILNTPSVNEKEKVYDFANLFSDNHEIEIYNSIMKYIELSNYDLAVVTINENNKYDEVEYADDFYDYNYFGFDNSFSGLLILIDMDNRVIYLSTTGYAIKMYDDDRIDYIIDAGYDYLTSGDYANSILSMIEEMSKYYEEGFPKSNENLIIDGTEVYYDNTKTIADYLLPSGGISLVITLIVSIIMYNKTRLKIKSINTVSYLTSERNLQITPRFIRSSISRILRSSDSGGSSRSGGGSSFHSSSSGRSHGGGGRHF